MRKTIKKLIIILAVISLSGLTSTAQEFKHKEFISSIGDTLRYRLLEPINSKTSKKYPLVLFLHGAGERGNDNEKQLKHGSQMFLNPVNLENYPAFILFPQCPEGDFWAYSRRPEDFYNMPWEEEMPPVFKAVKEMLDTYLQNPQVDKSRVYVMGISMGGMGTYDMASRFPDIFAAAIPICGAANKDRIRNAKDVKFRIYHGDADDIVHVECSRTAYRELKKNGASVEYFEFPGCDHLSWNPAFNSPDFLNWLFKQKK